jgi:DNA-binding transcriptional ArsR family regulator
MLAYVPVRFDLYRPLRPHLRWTLQCLVAFADRDGRCFPSVRKLAEVVGIGKSTVSRHLAQLERDGILTRQRKPGGVYSYRIDSRFLPAGRGVSPKCTPAVPPARTEEKPIKKTELAACPDLGPETFRWRARLRQLREQGLWVASYGPMPGQPGCRVPAEVLAAMR